MSRQRWVTKSDDPGSQEVTDFRGNRVKLLMWDRTGYLLIYKRLERGKFRLTTEPAAGCRHVELDAGDLALMLEGVDLRGVRRHQRWRPLAPQAAMSNAVP